MLSESGRPTLAEGEPDPATPARRRELARSMLAAAIRRYDEAVEALAAVEASYPLLDLPAAPADEAERRDRRGWATLHRQAEDDFDATELALAGAIKALYDLIAPEGARAGDSPDDYFVPRAVRARGKVYVLADDPDRLTEDHPNIVAVYREGMMIDLAAAPEVPIDHES